MHFALARQNGKNRAAVCIENNVLVIGYKRYCSERLTLSKFSYHASAAGPADTVPVVDERGGRRMSPTDLSYSGLVGSGGLWLFVVGVYYVPRAE